MEVRLAGLLGTARRVSKRQRAAAVQDVVRVREQWKTGRQPGLPPAATPITSKAIQGSTMEAASRRKKSPPMW